MTQAKLTQLSVLDLVPFGNAGVQTGFYALRLTPPDWTGWTPGQFVMLRHANADSSMIWGRPFSICYTSSRDLVIFFQVRGRGTAALSRLQPGALLDVWGPLGNGFAVEKDAPTLLLAGGIGIAPFVGYVLAHPRPLNITLEFGHRMPLECYPFDSITEKITARAHLEKGPKDRDDFIALMEERIKAFAGGLVLACGPTPFLQAVQSLSRKYAARTQLSLETRMACGVGACLGCVVKAQMPPDAAAPVINGPPLAPLPGDRGSYVQTCTCGPIFWADSVSLSQPSSTE
ncbi:dihydroorotate dehydrogenase electron transfer subunit [Desulfovibrio sp. OttesenSCG-928-F20]|nr:dihydroorotate dehydrogenase electron transfer subunit [Desulfovibrio sp. OttesenSCG-928-M16]MDL2291019.1 dihydroorotate dehydrogenase electron transfer subunit [Desulfovibrio sp. OttesenSCG-928-F20]